MYLRGAHGWELQPCEHRAAHISSSRGPTCTPQDADFSARVLLRLCAASPPKRLLPPGETKQQVQSGTGESHHAFVFAFLLLFKSVFVCTLCVCVHTQRYVCTACRSFVDICMQMISPVAPTCTEMFDLLNILGTCTDARMQHAALQSDFSEY